jgi:hypothetical protein
MARKSISLGLAILCIAAPVPAAAFELTGGVSVGGVLAGIQPRLAVSPHIGFVWHARSGFLLVARDMCSIVPAVDRHGAGVYERASLDVGYGSESFFFDIGPSLSAFYAPACISNRCDRLNGISPGGHVELSAYLAGPLGVAVSVDVNYLVGDLGALYGSVAAAAVAGPVLRWSAK